MFAAACQLQAPNESNGRVAVQHRIEFNKQNMISVTFCVHIPKGRAVVRRKCFPYLFCGCVVHVEALQIPEYRRHRTFTVDVVGGR